jgi:hypothetical protein
MRVEIASSCKSLWGNAKLDCAKTRRRPTHSWLLPSPLLDNARPAVIVIFSEADQPACGTSEGVLWGEQTNLHQLG